MTRRTFPPSRQPGRGPGRPAGIGLRLASAVAFAFALAGLLALAPVSPAHAGPGEPGHTHDEPKVAAVGPALPRFAATSDLFELVGVLDGRTLTLFLDEAATNAPVRGATLELEIAGRKVPVQPVADGAAATAGDFTATLAEPLPEGVHPVTATVTTPKDADLLAGEVDIHAAAGTPEHDHGGWLGELWAHRRAWVIGAGAALVAAAVALPVLTRRRPVGLHDGRPA